MIELDILERIPQLIIVINVDMMENLRQLLKDLNVHNVKTMIHKHVMS